MAQITMSSRHRNHQRLNKGESSSSSSSSLKNLTVLLSVSGILLTLFLYSVNGNQVQDREIKGNSVEVGSKRAGKTAEIITGTLDGGIPYYHCAGNQDKHLVLLHGARFSKEDWITSG